MNQKDLAAIELKAYRKLGTYFRKKNRILKYELFRNSEKFFIYKHKGGKGKIIAANGNTICTRVNETTIRLYPNYKNLRYKYTISMTPKKFEDLIPGSKIDLCFIIPYCRKCNIDKVVDSWRLVIITNKCQVYHNFPCHSDLDGFEGEYLPFDIIHFEESAVWDVPNKKYPSRFEAHDLSEYYFPFFNEESYEYHPKINGIIKNKSGNKGFPKYLNLDNGSFISRFYFPERKSESNPFFYLNGLEIDSKISLVGTYRSNTNSSARNVVFATVDGGRNWFAKYEFSDLGEYDFKQGNPNNWGNNHGKPIDGSILNSCSTSALVIRNRKLALNFKENYQIFEEPIHVEKIGRTCPILLKTKDKHHLKTGNIVVLQGSIDGIAANLLNNNASSSNNGNGIFFKVVVKDDYSICLYENVSSTTNTLPCRHIHFIDRQRDGWTIGTGEIYPNGWLMFMCSREGDTYSDIDIKSTFITKQLTFKKESIQRAMGLYLFSNGDDTDIIYASDHDTLDMQSKIGDCELLRNSTGVYKGKQNILENYKFSYPIFETNEPSLFFKLFGDFFLYGGQRGTIAFGHDFGQRWEVLKLENPIKRFLGETFDFLVIDNYLFIRK